MKYRSIFVSLLIYALFLTLASCGENFYKNSGFVWGTTYKVTYKARHDMRDSVIDAMRQIEHSLSMFDSLSTVSKINRRETTETDSMFRVVFAFSCEVNRISRGAFDPTVQPLVQLWGFGPSGHVKNRPDSAAIDSALAGVGIRKARIENNRIVLGHPDMKFDFSAVAKGYGVDCIGDMLQRNGCKDYLIEIGGDILAMGTNPEGQPWRIQIDAPVIAEDGVALHNRMAAISVLNKGVATSGNYRNYIKFNDGTLIGHTINPITGCPVTTLTLSVTVVADDCLTADAYATAAMAMHYVEARSMIERIDGVDALFVVAHAASPDGFVIYATPGFPELED